MPTVNWTSRLTASSMFPSVFDRYMLGKGKLEMLSYALAQQELLPYLPLEERTLLTEHAWIEATLMVADHIVRWCRDALALQRRHAAAVARPDGDAAGPASTPQRPGA